MLLRFRRRPRISAHQLSCPQFRALNNCTTNRDVTSLWPISAEKVCCVRNFGYDLHDNYRTLKFVKNNWKMWTDLCRPRLLFPRVQSYQGKFLLPQRHFVVSPISGSYLHDENCRVYKRFLRRNLHLDHNGLFHHQVFMLFANTAQCTNLGKNFQWNDGYDLPN